MKHQAEFFYKVKPRYANQFKAAETNGVPFAIILGEDEVAQGKVRIKELGLQKGHPEKDGVLVDESDVVLEVKNRLRRISQLDAITSQAEGLRVVHGIRQEDVNPGDAAGQLVETGPRADRENVPAQAPRAET
jgi:histidyl-tRNA synthetase